MRKPHDQSDTILDRFDAWLKETPVSPDSGFLAAVRTRLNKPSKDVDAVIDDLLRPNPELSDPHLAARIRQRMERSDAARARAQWVQWLTPLAAAATLTLAFVSFQTQAPDHMTTIAMQSAPAPVIATDLETDTDLTEIFALAANLHGPADVSSLQSVDNLAYLFE